MRRKKLTTPCDEILTFTAGLEGKTNMTTSQMQKGNFIAGLHCTLLSSWHVHVLLQLCILVCYSPLLISICVFAERGLRKISGARKIYLSFSPLEGEPRLWDNGDAQQTTPKSSLKTFPVQDGQGASLLKSVACRCTQESPTQDALCMSIWISKLFLWCERSPQVGRKPTRYPPR